MHVHKYIHVHIHTRTINKSLPAITKKAWGKNIKAIMNKKQKDEEAEKEKAVKAEKVRAAKEKVKAEGGAQVVKAKTLPIFEHYHKHAINEMARQPLIKLKDGKKVFSDKPIIFETEFKIPDELSSSFDTFMDKLSKSTHYTGSGRGALGANLLCICACF